jgi:type VI secretion system FHA domain protein
MEPLGDSGPADGSSAPLRLRIVAAPAGMVPPKLDLPLVVKEDGPLTIGRLENNDLVLPDDNLHVSRCHCRVDEQDGMWLLQNRSAVNGAKVNERLLAENEVVAIKAGDTVRIVGYLLHVEEIAASEEKAARQEEGDSPPGGSTRPAGPDVPRVAGQGEDDPFQHPESAPMTVLSPPRTVLVSRDTGSADGDHRPGNAPHPAETAPGNDDNALAAFLAGAGLPSLPQGTDPATAMRALGESSRLFLRTLALLLAARCQLARDFRTTRRHITPTRANPFKVLVDEGDMLAFLLGETRPGFTSGPAAVAEACDDLVEHQLALLAELQAKLDQVMQRLSPKELAGTTKRGLLGGTAKLWERYEAVYGDVQRDVESNLAVPHRLALARAVEVHAKRRD